MVRSPGTSISRMGAAQMYGTGCLRVITILDDAALPVAGILVICNMVTYFYLYFYDDDQKRCFMTMHDRS